MSSAPKNAATSSRLSDLLATQARIGSSRPKGDAHYESDNYSHDAYLWDVQQKAIDACRADMAQSQSGGSKPA